MSKVSFSSPLWYLMTGCRADRLGVAQNGHSAETIVIEFGSFSDLFTGLDVYAMEPGSDYLYVDPYVVGPNGRDVATIWPEGTEVQPWFIVDGNNRVAAILSASQADYRQVLVPPGWTLVRMHPWAGIWKSGWLPGRGPGFPDFHFAGIQNPWIDLTLGVQASNKFIKNETVPGGISRRDWLPSIVPMSTARLIRARCVLYPQGGAGSAWIGASQQLMTPIGTYNAGEQPSVTVFFRPESDGSYYFQSNCPMDAWAEAYCITNTA